MQQDEIQNGKERIINRLTEGAYFLLLPGQQKGLIDLMRSAGHLVDTQSFHNIGDYCALQLTDVIDMCIYHLSKPEPQDIRTRQREDCLALLNNVVAQMYGDVNSTTEEYKEMRRTDMDQAERHHRPYSPHPETLAMHHEAQSEYAVSTVYLALQLNGVLERITDPNQDEQHYLTAFREHAEKGKGTHLAVLDNAHKVLYPTLEQS